MKKFLLLLFSVFILTPIVSAQINDAQFWENIIVEKTLSKKLSVRVVQQGRITENITRPSFNYFDLGGNYKLNKHVHLCLAYVWAIKRQLDDTWSNRHQAYASVTFKGKWKDFVLNDRNMILWQVKDVETSRYGRYPDYYYRNKMTLRYELNFHWAPYLAAEAYYHLNSHDVAAYSIDRTRYFAGLFYRLNIYHELEGYYMIERHPNTVDPATNWVIGLGYTYSF